MSLHFANKPADASAEQSRARGRTVQDARGRTVGFIAPRVTGVAFGSTTDVLPADALAMNCDPYNRLGRTCAEMIYKRLR
jgi:hypothetical protein